MSLANDLFPSEAVECLFGLSEPPWDEVAVLFAAVTAGNTIHTDADRKFDECTVGLLVCRAWKILTRTSTGLAVLLTGDASNEDKIDPAFLWSFTAVQQVLSGLLVRDELRQEFSKWIAALPTSKVAENVTLSPKERSFLLSSIEAGHVDWHSSKPKWNKCKKE